MSRGFLLDTNIPSELTRPMPEPRVKAWVAAQETSSLHLNAIVAGELRKGVSLLPLSRRRTQLERWLENDLLPLFFGRVLPITDAIGNRWGVLSASRQTRGNPLSMADGLIAATALEHDLTLVTRNSKDFAGLGLEIMNPWTAV